MRGVLISPGGVVVAWAVRSGVRIPGDPCLPLGPLARGVYWCIPNLAGHGAHPAEHHGGGGVNLLADGGLAVGDFDLGATMPLVSGLVADPLHGGTAIEEAKPSNGLAASGPHGEMEGDEDGGDENSIF